MAWSPGEKNKMVKKKVEVKKWWESKTLIINILTILVGVGSIISGQIEAGVSITGLGVLNAVLRVITTKKLQF